MWASLSVGAHQTTPSSIYCHFPSAVRGSVAVNGSMTHPLCSPEHSLQP